MREVERERERGDGCGKDPWRGSQEKELELGQRKRRRRAEEKRRRKKLPWKEVILFL